VENFAPLVPKTDLIDDLVLEKEAKDMIKALSKSYTAQIEVESREAGRWSADFIQNKGDGQIFLLHGKPGVGKTT
jgi:putative ribosome biogenesis GTPase RsgA